ncbi:MAG: ogr/Delta-like zinc finger family protein [Betaproteobacteria bacterium]|nr:ogr/Delta-like zinc finger family protein [Betaproteobacteria bacterium]
MRVCCPHCGTTARIRTSRSVSEISREAYIQCQNYQCGHSWKEIQTASLTIVPSKTPNPRVYIPTSASTESARARQPGADETTPRAAQSGGDPGHRYPSPAGRDG